MHKLQLKEPKPTANIEEFARSPTKLKLTREISMRKKATTESKTPVLDLDSNLNLPPNVISTISSDPEF